MNTCKIEVAVVNPYAVGSEHHNQTEAELFKIMNNLGQVAENALIILANDVLDADGYCCFYRRGADDNIVDLDEVARLSIVSGGWENGDPSADTYVISFNGFTPVQDFGAVTLKLHLQA